MAVFRILRAPSALRVEAFTSYSDALNYSRANGLQSKPVRRLERGSIVWHVPTVAQGLKSRPDYVKLPDWQRPSYYQA